MDPIHFTLHFAIPTLNKWERMHWRAKVRFKRMLAQEIALAMIGQRPSVPIAAVFVQIFRHSVGVPTDDDNLIAKAVLDVLQPPSKRHPYGLGVISGDDPATCRHTIVPIREKHRTEQKTVVVIRELAEMPARNAA